MSNDVTQSRYNDPLGGTASDIGPQINTAYWEAMALKEAVKEQVFTPLASVKAMPKHYGKKIKQFHYMPLLDDRNLNDQGIDAAGVTLSQANYVVTFPSLTVSIANAGSAAAVAAINDALDAASNIASDGADDSAGTGFTTITLTATTQLYADLTDANAAAANVGGSVLRNSGNLYGSSKDVGSITSKLPLLSETGGRVNRVGNTRIELEVELQKLGFFYEYTKESLDFDTDSELYAHIAEENIRGASEMSEDILQIDLLNAPGVIRYGGIATEDIEITGEGDDISIVSYAGLQRMSIDLDNNNCPKKTKVITGSRMIDTKVVSSGRYLYCGSEMIPTLTKMTDHFNNPAFIAVEHYAGAGNVKDANAINGEIGTIGHFRIVQVQKMIKWAGAGAVETEANAGYSATNGKYDVFPMLCIGSESFTTIGFQTAKGGGSKFRIKHVKPESDAAYSSTDPFGETGYTSIKWYYATMILRPEYIALYKTVAEE